MKRTMTYAAVGIALTGLLAACGNSGDPSPTAISPNAISPNATSSVETVHASSAPTARNGGKHFNRVATFAVCAQLGSSCETREETAAEIVAASTDGMTLIYTNSPKDEVGFVDITDPSTAPWRWARWPWVASPPPSRCKGRTPWSRSTPRQMATS